MARRNSKKGRKLHSKGIKGPTNVGDPNKGASSKGKKD